MDLVLFGNINGLANRWPFLDWTGILLASQLQYLIVGFLLLIPFLPKWKTPENRSMVIVAIASALFSRFVITEAIRLFYHRPRPFLVLESTHKLINVTSGVNYLDSFPSGHSAFFFGLAAAVYFHNRKLGVFFLVTAFLIGAARVFTGVHWPSDIIGGVAVGFAGAWIINFLFTKARNSKLNLWRKRGPQTA